MIRPSCLLSLLLALALSSSAAAQTPDPAAPSNTTARSIADPQIDLNLISLPTTQSVKRHHGYFRLNHRFARDLRLGTFGDLAADLFALDNGAVLGLEYRFGLTDSLHGGVHRSTEAKTLQVFGRWDTIRQGNRFPVGASAVVSTEGLDNLQEARQPALGAVFSRTWGQRLAVYASPTYVDGTYHAALVAANADGHGDASKELPDVAVGDLDNRTIFVGLGTRVRLRPSVFAVGEYSPRLSGYAPGDPMWGLALEKWTRGHTLALTLTNSFATTPGQIARGGTPSALYVGFNITRKF